MARQDSFVDYTLELLEPLGPVQARGMFGGWGIYHRGLMFGLIAEGRFYLKVDDVTRPAFEAATGCEPFVYRGADKPMTMNYWTPPTDAQDDAIELLPWARRAVQAAERAAAKKAPKKKAAVKKAAPPAKKKPAAKKRASRVKPS